MGSGDRFCALSVTSRFASDMSDAGQIGCRVCCDGLKYVNGEAALEIIEGLIRWSLVSCNAPIFSFK